MTNKVLVYVAAGLVWLLCLHAALLAFGVFSGTFNGLNEPFGWYFLAKGVFCSLSLLLARSLLAEFRALRRDWAREPADD